MISAGIDCIRGGMRGGMINRRENSPRGNDEPGTKGWLRERMLNERVVSFGRGTLANQQRKLVRILPFLGFYHNGVPMFPFSVANTAMYSLPLMFSDP